MKVAVYGKNFSDNFGPAIQFLFTKLADRNVNLCIYNPFCKFLYDKISMPPSYAKFHDHEGLKAEKPDLLLSIGGDGTILDAITLVRDINLPILGINTGRLGFLSSVAREEISTTVKHIVNQEYEVEERSLLEIEHPKQLFSDQNFALNELSVLKKESSSMITVHAFINDQYLNSYWADGLIIATPTGSTAYSLSCGGPILVPDARNFVLTPISPHNLNVRPIVIADSNRIKLRVEGRDDNFLVAMDSRTATLSSNETIEVKKADFNIQLAKLPFQNFYHTLRNKLMWGLDRRN
ncbi:MAG: NAD kinase [Luteibaculum sp.]